MRDCTYHSRRSHTPLRFLHRQMEMRRCPDLQRTMRAAGSPDRLIHPSTCVQSMHPPHRTGHNILLRHSGRRNFSSRSLSCHIDPIRDGIRMDSSRRKNLNLQARQLSPHRGLCLRPDKKRKTSALVHFGTDPLGMTCKKSSVLHLGTDPHRIAYTLCWSCCRRRIDQPHKGCRILLRLR